MDGTTMADDPDAVKIKDGLQNAERGLGVAIRHLDAIIEGGTLNEDDLAEAKAYRQVLKGSRHAVKGAHAGLEALANKSQKRFGGK